MEIFVLWLALSVVAGAIASNRGRSGWGFFFLSVVLSPIIGIIAALIATPNRKNVEEKQIASGDNKKCPYCAEIIKREAKVCRYCGKELPAAEPPTPSLSWMKCPQCGQMIRPDPKEMKCYLCSHDLSTSSLPR